MTRCGDELLEEPSSELGGVLHVTLTHLHTHTRGISLLRVHNNLKLQLLTPTTHTLLFLPPSVLWKLPSSKTENYHLFLCSLVFFSQRIRLETIFWSCVTVSGSFRALSLCSHFYYDARKKKTKKLISKTLQNHTPKITGLLGKGGWGRSPKTCML